MSGYMDIVKHYEDCYEQHGDSHLGVDWPDKLQATVRHGVMLGIIDRSPCTLLDFGCGLSHLYETIVKYGRKDEIIDYSGLDISPVFAKASRDKYPTIPYYCLDVLTDDVSLLPEFDYVVANGVFTEKREMPWYEMWVYVQHVIRAIFPMVRVGLAFNVMSPHLDWQRDDLFHLPLDALASFLRANISPHFAIRNDYGLYEYTVYVYKEVEWRTLLSSA